MYPDQAGSRRTGVQNHPGAQPPRFSEGVRGLIHTAVSWGLRARAGSPDGSAWAGPRGGAQTEVMPSTPCRGAGVVSEPSEAEAPGDQAEPTASPDCLPPPASLGREVQTPQVHTLPVGPAGLTAQPSCPLFTPPAGCSGLLPPTPDPRWGPGRGLGQHRPMGPPCCPRSGLGGVGAGSGPRPPRWWPHSLTPHQQLGNRTKI